MKKLLLMSKARRALAIVALALGTVATTLSFVSASGPVAVAADDTRDLGANTGDGSTTSTTSSDLESTLGTGGFGDDWNLVNSVGGVIATIARAVGIFVAIFGLYKLIIALKDQDANGITQAVILIAVGGALIAFKSILNSVFHLGL